MSARTQWIVVAIVAVLGTYACRRIEASEATAPAPAAETLPAKLSEVDRLRFHNLVLERQLAVHAVQDVDAKIEAAKLAMTGTYKIGPADRVDIATGDIKRGAAAPQEKKP